MLVRIDRYFNYPDISRQTPGGSMKWGNFHFTEEKVEKCDYLVILEYPKAEVNTSIPSGNFIHICQEPPNEVSIYRQFGNKQSNLILNQHKEGGKFVLSHGALPWHVNKSYDELNSTGPRDFAKKDEIAWITGYQQTSKGHVARSRFLDSLRDIPYVNLYGRGINPIDDKWDALFPVKYGIAYENFSSPFYWTEKIADCFLSYTIPFYSGCTNIQEFFPKGSFILFDPNDKHIELMFKDVIQSNYYEKHFDALLEARELILNQYQLFPFLHGIITEIEKSKSGREPSGTTQINVPGGDQYFDNYPFIVSWKKFLRRLSKKLDFN